MTKRWIVKLERNGLSAGRFVSVANTRAEARLDLERRHPACVVVSVSPERKPK